MDLHKLLEGNCGQNNPISNLASHITQDHAFQGQISLPSTSRQITSFKLDELWHEIENVEFPRNAMPSVTSNTANFLGNNRTNNYRNEYVQNNIWANQEVTQTEINPIEYEYLQQPHIPIQGLFHPYGQMHLPPNGRYQPHPLEMYNQYYEQQGQISIGEEEFAKLNYQIEESQREFMQLDNDLEQLEEKSKKEAKTKKKVFWFDGLSIEEAFNAAAPDIEWSEAENFYLFVNNYMRKEQHDFDLHIEKEFKFSETNPYTNIDDPLSQGLRHFTMNNYSEAILCYEASVQKDKNSITGWKMLIVSLLGNGQVYEAYHLMNKCKHLNSDVFSRLMYSLLVDEQYYYQGCQVILNWLKNHSDYSDIVPRDYVMEDKSSNLIEEKQLNDLKQMLTKAAERQPITPDYNVQVALSTVLEISRDYNTDIRDNWWTLSQNDSLRNDNNGLSEGINCLLRNEPHNAINIFNKLKKTASVPLKYRCEELLGLSNLYLKNYEKAGQCLLAALYTTKAMSNKAWIQLRLCTELMRRNDLSNLVKQKDFLELCKAFNCKYRPRRHIFSKHRN